MKNVGMPIVPKTRGIYKYLFYNVLLYHNIIIYF